MSQPISHGDLVTFAAKTVNLPGIDVQAGRDRVKTLRERLEKYIDANPGFNLVKMLGAGSVAKGTALRNIQDMDVAVYVTQAAAPDDSKLIDWMADRLREAYGGWLKPEQIQPGTHCVNVSFRSDGGLDVDVVPVLYEGEADGIGYLVARDTGERLKTSVPRHLEFVRKRKSDQPTDYAQIVRFVKWWVREQQAQDEAFRFKSFLVELVVAHLADGGLDLSDYPTALEEVFAYIVGKRLGERIAFTDYYKLAALPPKNGLPIEVFDPVNCDNNVAYSYTTRDRDRIIAAAELALDAIVEARGAATKAQAVECWQVVFGPSFRG
jgi:hypothetical protein